MLWGDALVVRVRITGESPVPLEPAANAKTSEVILNGADGLEFATLINAAMVFQVRKASILRHVGSVTYARRSQIAQKLRAALGLG